MKGKTPMQRVAEQGLELEAGMKRSLGLPECKLERQAPFLPALLHWNNKPNPAPCSGGAGDAQQRGNQGDSR